MPFRRTSPWRRYHPIKKDDLVSKMVCQSCCEIAFKLHKYRTNSISNDKLLKEKHSGNNEKDVGPPQDNLFRSMDTVRLFNSTIENELSNHLDPFKQAIENKGKPKVTEPPKNIPIRTTVKCHESIKKILKTNPGLIICNNIFSQDLLPVVSIDKAEVTNWYAEQINKVKQKLGFITITKLTLAPNETITKPPTSNEPVENISDKKLPSNIFENKSKTSAINRIENSTEISSKVKVVKTSEIAQLLKASNAKSLDKGNDIAKTINFNLRKAISEKSQITVPQKPQNSESKIKSKNNQNITTKCVAKKRVSTSNTNPQNTSTSMTKLRESKRTKSEAPSITRNTSKTDGAISSKKICVRPNTTETRIDSAIVGAQRTGNNGKGESNVQPKIISNVVEISNDSKVNDPSASKVINETEKKQDSLKQHKLPTPERDSLFIIDNNKSLKVFICPTCSLVCETKKMLVFHQRKHFSCTSCKKKFKSLTALETHVNYECLTSRVKDNAMIQLVRVDTIPTMIEKYSKAFEVLNKYDSDSDGIYNDDSLQYYDYDMECIDDVKIEVENHEVTNNTKIENDLNVICISDDNSNDVSIVLETERIHVQESYLVKFGNTLYEINTVHKNENEMIKYLFQKYYASNTTSTKTQTLQATNKNIRCKEKNIIILEQMLSELQIHRVPIRLECKSKVCARYSKPQCVQDLFTLEYWGHKKSIGVTKPSALIKSANMNSSPNKLSNVQDDTHSLPFKIVDVSTVTNTSTISETTSPKKTLPTESRLQQLLLDTPCSNNYRNSKTNNAVLPVFVENYSSQPMYSLTSSDVHVFSPNTILTNSTQPTTKPVVVSNSVPPLNNFILLSNPTVPAVVNNISYTTIPLTFTNINNTDEQRAQLQ
ncbi:hypothetical protein FQR65_LT13670 [Abscondita terminalis]|nr:hypothetical protein FQR65_LT13670 [Abscondita terminalis]